MTKNPYSIERVLYGYSIGECLEFRVSPALLINIKTGKTLRLRATMSRLLNYLLFRSKEKLIEDERIMVDVFENFGLRCSKQRLWQAIRALKNVMIRLGYSKELILRVNNAGFTLSDVRIDMLLISTQEQNQ